MYIAKVSRWRWSFRSTHGSWAGRRSGASSGPVVVGKSGNLLNAGIQQIGEGVLRETGLAEIDQPLRPVHFDAVAVAVVDPGVGERVEKALNQLAVRGKVSSRGVIVAIVNTRDSMMAVRSSLLP